MLCSYTSSIYRAHIHPKKKGSLGLNLPLILFIKFLIKFKNNGNSKPRPPGPTGWPLVGNIFNLGELPHQTFHELRAKYGPVMWLKLGTINTLVVQSPEAAAELFKKCDLPLADRQVPDSLTAFGYNRGSLAVGAYSDYWRDFRRICTKEFMVQKRVADSVSVRQKCIDEMIVMIKKEMTESEKNGESGEIQLDRFLSVMLINTVGNLTMSRDIMDMDMDLDMKLSKGREFLDSFRLFFEWVGKPNLADFFPFLKWMDPQRIRRNTAKYLEKLIEFTSEVVKERIKEKQSAGKDVKNTSNHDLLDALLDEAKDMPSVKNIAVVLLEMFFGGVETTTTTIEWGMAELVRHPSSMLKIQEEMDQVVGRTRKEEEKDLPKMLYLQATVKEVLRLHPPIQLLLPRNAREDTEFMGFFVPKNIQVYVNAWAIHRDPAAWPDPMSFNPERFLDSCVDLKGQHFQLIPFGSGRRSCLGVTTAERMVGLTIATLLHSFDWKFVDGAVGDQNMKERVGFSTLRKNVPLKLIPTQRE